MRRALRVTAVLLVIVAALVVAYEVGYYTSPGKAGAVGATTLAAGPNAAATPSTLADETRQRFEIFWEAWNLVEREFYNGDEVDRQKMTYGAIKGMLESLGDNHTTFVEPSHAKLSEEDMRGSFDGIGVTVEMKEKRLTIVAPLDDSPGARAGLRPADVIAKVDGTDTATLNIMQAVALIRGPRGTAVRLTIERPSESEPLFFEIVRAAIPIVTVKALMMDGDVAYVKVTQFSEPTAHVLKQKLKELTDKKARAVILDLRNNAGGLLNSAIDVASEFIGDGIVLYEQRRDTPLESFNARRGGVATRLPVVVLINQGSASASEIVAGALQDLGRGVLVGEPSYGKDTVQNVHQLVDRSSVRITIARWYTPNKQEIRGKGLQPDVTVPLTGDDAKAGRDPQLERALERARTGS